jgi:hypothetical protein
MARKKWTAQTEITEALIRIREKRKWQIALRRYVLEKKWSSAYAPYFGLGIDHFREWISLQFEGEANWDNFAIKWQFDHIVPLTYFNFANDSDLSICWNFTNIRISSPAAAENPGASSQGQNGIDILGAKRYFESLYTSTGYQACRNMLKKLGDLEAAQLATCGPREAFLFQNAPFLSSISDFNAYEYQQLNDGVPMKTILDGRAFSAKIHGAKALD